MTAPLRPEHHALTGSPDLAEHEPLADAGVRALLVRYAALSVATLREIGPYRYELAVPEEDRAAFDGRAIVRIAFSVEALQDDPAAEMAVLGSAFVEQLVAAVRRRGVKRTFGLVPPTVPLAAEAARLPVPVANGEAGVPGTRLSHHPVGRLTARVTLRAGASVEEHLVESGLFDLVTGAALPADVAAACETTTASGPLGSAECAAPRPMADLVALMLGDLEVRLSPEIERQRTEAERALAHELARIDRYYTTLLTDSAGRGSEIPGVDARRAVEAEHARRREEEIRRHDVRAVVHPLQLAEWTVQVQRAEWPLTSREGRRAVLVAQRALSGTGDWTLACPTCGTAPPSAIVVCRHEHAGCAACATTCMVCEAGCCRDHGLASCHVDGRPACDEHARTCRSCRRPHCTTHEGTCEDGGHPACMSCLTACSHCGRTVCDAHATSSNPGAALGVRRLCAECVRYCEGGTGEVVGPDEVTRCASCERVVCVRHQTTCAVDGEVHCSSHMRRTDRSRRLVCEHDRAACAYEPSALFALDEVGPCVTCGTVACDQHMGVCMVDGQRHCTTHLVRLRDQDGATACAAHHTVCHVDRVAFSLTGTAECPVCGRRACAQHRRACDNCGRSVCSGELDGTAGRRCVTCRRLAPLDDPEDRVIQAAVAAREGSEARPKSWRAARDATHLVVELDLGWTRRVVFTVRHGDSAPDGGMAHSLLGSRPLKGGN